MEPLNLRFADRCGQMMFLDDGFSADIKISANYSRENAFTLVLALIKLKFIHGY